MNPSGELPAWVDGSWRKPGSMRRTYALMIGMGPRLTAAVLLYVVVTNTELRHVDFRQAINSWCDDEFGFITSTWITRRFNSCPRDRPHHGAQCSAA